MTTEAQARSRVEQIDQQVEDLLGGQHRANRRNAPAHLLDQRWRRMNAQITELRAERAALAPLIPYRDDETGDEDREYWL